MFTRMKNFVKNHWKKVVIGGVTVHVVSYGLRYATSMLIRYHEAQAQEVWKKLKKQQHYESTEETCTTTFTSLLPKLAESLSFHFNVDALTAQLKTNTSDRKSVWEELKIIAFSRVIVCIYGSTLLNVLLRIQLGIISGYLFQDSHSETKDVMTNVNGAILSNVSRIDSDVQHKYLSLANHLVTDGIKNLCELVRRKTEEVVGTMSLKQRLCVNDIEQILWGIVTLVKRECTNSSGSKNSTASPILHPWKYIYPEDIIQEYNLTGEDVSFPRQPADMFKKLVLETFDLLDSDDVTGIMKALESHGISHFLDRFAEAIIQTQDGNQEQAFDLNDMFVQLAKAIPIMNTISASTLDETDPWIHILLNTESIRTLGANVYESFSCPELV